MTEWADDWSIDPRAVLALVPHSEPGADDLRAILEGIIAYEDAVARMEARRARMRALMLSSTHPESWRP